jgi:hypothetical protein
MNRRNDVCVKKLDRFYREASKEIRANLGRGFALTNGTFALGLRGGVGAAAAGMTERT